MESLLCLEFGSKGLTFCFRNATNDCGTTLNLEQFLNFNDIIRDASFDDLVGGIYPLSSGLWFCTIQFAFLSSRTQQKQFRFNHVSWHNYINKVHWVAMITAKDASFQSDKHDACYATSYQMQSKSNRLETIIGRQILRWSATYVGHSNEQRQKYSNFQRRLHSNPWTCFR